VADWINDKICELSDSKPDFCFVSIRMTIAMEDFPEEFGLFVSSTQGDIVLDFPAGSFLVPGTFTMTVDLPPGTYMFKVTDSRGDGLCCDYGHIHFDIHAFFPNEDQLIAQGDGQFTDEVTVVFSVPFPSQIESLRMEEVTTLTTSGVCQDQTRTFTVDADVGEANCEWLEVNLERYDHLCKLLDVAAACPATCNACEHFQ
jgi:hypothetical protein